MSRGWDRPRARESLSVISNGTLWCTLGGPLAIWSLSFFLDSLHFTPPPFMFTGARRCSWDVCSKVQTSDSSRCSSSPHRDESITRVSWKIQCQIKHESQACHTQHMGTHAHTHTHFHQVSHRVQLHLHSTWPSGGCRVPWSRFTEHVTGWWPHPQSASQRLSELWALGLLGPHCCHPFTHALPQQTMLNWWLV